MSLPLSATAITFVLTCDRAVSDAFYRDTLGLRFVTDDGSLRITHVPDHAAAPHPVLGWQVADIAATVADLTGKGVAMILYPGMGQDETGVWTAPGGSARVAFFADPDGNVLSLTQS